MTELRQRTIGKTNKESKPKTPVTPPSKKSYLSTFLIFILILLSSSYVITNTWTFGYKLPSFKRVKRVLEKELVLTKEELSKFDGSDPSLPIYIAINGKIYDVSAGSSYYGPGGSYHFFSGKDAARAYITGCFQTHLTHDLRGLTDSQIESLKSWTDFYEKSSKYFYVGKVLHDPIDPESPIPKDCNV